MSALNHIGTIYNSYFHLKSQICLSLHCFIGWLLCFFPFHPQRWLNMPAALHPSCWEKPYPPSPRTWTLTPIACPSECVLASLLLTSLPWFLSGCSLSAWCVAIPTLWSPLNGSQDAPCSWPKCFRMPGHQMVHSTSSTASMQVSVFVCPPPHSDAHDLCVG